MSGPESLEAARRALLICNVCGYCDGYCDVFRAARRRRDLADGDLRYLASLCHNCGNCFYACQYAPPHAFAVNVPRTLADARRHTYRTHAWPRAVGALVAGRIGVLPVAAALALLAPALAWLLVPAAVLFAPHRGPGAFYAVVPWPVMSAVGALAAGWSALAVLAGVVGFWRGIGDAGGKSVRRALPAALRDVLTLRNLGGGGHGCNDRDETFSRARRRLHHAMFYGFLLCAAATGAATLRQHLLGDAPPYPWLSLPVLLGGAGGVGMMVGGIGAGWRKLTAPAAAQSTAVRRADLGLLAGVLAMAGSGLLLLLLRTTGAMGLVLALHLGVVAAGLLVLPYGTFAHGAYRAAALLRAAAERTDGTA